MIFLPVLLLTFFLSSSVQAEGWLCEEAASIREGNYLTVCGIGEDKIEDSARKTALNNAFAELDLICNRSADCKGFETNIEPMRNECKSHSGQFKCYRAIHVEITTTKKAMAPGDSSARQLQLTAKESTFAEKITDWKCDLDLDSVRQKLSDLSQSEKRKAAIDAATQVPFLGACRQFHFEVMTLLRQEKISDQQYNQFLLLALKSLTTPEDMKSTPGLWDYFYSQGLYSEKTWSFLLETLTRTQKSALPYLAPYLFQPQLRKESDRTVEIKHLHQLIELANTKRIGKPTPLPSSEALLFVQDGVFNQLTEKTVWFVFAFLNANLQDIPSKGLPNLQSTILKILSYPLDTKTHLEALQYLTRAYKQTKPEDISIRQFADILQTLKKMDPPSSTLLKTFVHDNSEIMDAVFARIQDPWDREFAVGQCLDYQIACPHLIPSPDKIKTMIESGNRQEKRLAYQILEKRGPLGQPLEAFLYAQLLNELRRREDHQAIEGAIHALLAIPTQNPQHIQKLIDLSLETFVPYEQVIQKIGPAATPLLLLMAKDSRQPARPTCVEMLGIAARQDPRAKQALETFAKEDDDLTIRKAARDALDSLVAR